MNLSSSFKTFLISSLLTASFSSLAKEKIVGGEKVTSLQDAPYMVSLSGSCGGSIISPRWVLTAAHCAGYFSEVKGGILNLKERGKKFRVRRVIKHPKYDSFTMSNDFALVELYEEMDFKNSTMRPVQLATSEFAADGSQDPGVDATVYGFGDLGSRQTNDTEDLNKVVLPIVSNDEANAPGAYDGQIDETMIAAGFGGGGKDSCQGDSGGPLVVFNQDKSPVQVGVVSWGEGCALPGKFGIYSKVSSVYEWIKETTQFK